MDANTLKRLDETIKRLRDYDHYLARGRIFGPKLQQWIWRLWPVAAPVLFTYLTTLVFPSLRITELWAYIVAYGLYSVVLLWFVLFPYVGEGGFRWKRLILLGPAGDIDVRRPNMVLRWVPAPRANTYEAENRFFQTLGVPKPDEFPWDYAFMPQVFLLTPLALVLFVLAINIAIHTREPSWSILVGFVLFAASCFSIYCIMRSLSRVKRDRRQRGAA
jgi:hypothetical protein